MSLKIAIQLDDFKNFHPKTDSTLELGLKAQDLGYKVDCYNPKNVTVRNGEIFADVMEVKFFNDENNFVEITKTAQKNLRNYDVILMRQNPPFDLNYITYCHLLERLKSDVLVLNDPKMVREYPEKLSVLDFPESIPETIITSNFDELDKFINDQKSAVMKPLYCFGGKDVFHIDNKKTNLHTIFEHFKDNVEGPILTQSYLKNVVNGDVRAIIIDGEFCGALKRKPLKDEIRANMAVGGIPEIYELNQKQSALISKVGKYLKEKGIFLAGVDLIDEYLIEINITCPTGLRTIRKLSKNLDVAEIFWSKVKRYL